MECSCACSFDGGEYAALSRVETVRARKQHDCIECGEPIRAGVRYERVTGLWDGNWETYATCLRCVTIRKAVCQCGHVAGDLVEEVRECFGFDYREDPSEWDEDEVNEQDAAHREQLRREEARRRARLVSVEAAP